MRNLMFVAIFLLACFATAVPTALGQVSDPTDQGRYFQHGKETSFEGAKIVNSLPAGAKCVPATAAGVVGSRFWNSTGPGIAILVTLTEKAEVATTTNGEMFMCKCVDGTKFNRIFRAESKTTECDSCTLLAKLRLEVNELKNKPADTRTWADAKSVADLEKRIKDLEPKVKALEEKNLEQDKRLDGLVVEDDKLRGRVTNLESVCPIIRQTTQDGKKTITKFFERCPDGTETEVVFDKKKGFWTPVKVGVTVAAVGGTATFLIWKFWPRGFIRVW